MAFQHMRRGQRANCVPGVRAFTLKKEFVATWQEVRGRCGRDVVATARLVCLHRLFACVSHCREQCIACGEVGGRCKRDAAPTALSLLFAQAVAVLDFARATHLHIAEDCLH